MIKVEKDFADIPTILKSENRKEAFSKNIIAKSFDNGTKLYNPDKVKKRLYKIYNLKCAYCEKDIRDEPRHVEHYRPKNIYYWLGYSWDNLLLCCAKCNTSKDIKFETLNQRVTYNNENFDDIHNLSDGYNEIEKPKIINPEKEDVLEYIIFNRDAIMDSTNDRVKYTIDDVCKLNRDSLVEKRIQLLNTFIFAVTDYSFLFDKDNNQDKSQAIKPFISLIKRFIEDCKKESEFYSLRYYILNHIEIFFDDLQIQKIVKSLFVKIRTIT